ncbi:MAG: hypothetical protein KatS3mg131_3404 [Candidatus Tectimicrobiota bacterium]|nr:MAG: hypothetical protein KatS3mg131_3404 [Candidatus Tectomicrobia bacterium]
MQHRIDSGFLADYAFMAGLLALLVYLWLH